ncbi:MAG: ABC transporter ATP-binding protein, partial [Erysipelotrichaceae bacterium]|nr:ABC transporter ATP-binding protein [Erysipelotrichaceae bacterium]
VLNNLKKDKTLFVITHRLDLIRHFDHILVMQNGKIMEEGNHDTLMEKNGVYASLWNKETERKSK